MSDEHEPRLPQPERWSQLDQELQDSTAGNLGIPRVDRMTPVERERQVEKRLPESGVIATWVILIGMAVLVVLAFVLSVR